MTVLDVEALSCAELTGGGAGFVDDRGGSALSVAGLSWVMVLVVAWDSLMFMGKMMK